MKTMHRFTFPTETVKSPLTMSNEFDLHVHIGDWVEFKLMSGCTWEITRKKFHVEGDNTVDFVDYLTKLVENPELP